MRRHVVSALASMLGVVAMTAGSAHSQIVRAWGNNSFGQCTVPSEVGDAVAIAAGGAHSIALRADGSVICWGFNDWGQCSVPADLGPTVAIASGNAHNVALRSDGLVRCWGRNDNGQCSVPADLGPATAIAGGSWHSMALSSDGLVRCWGLDGSGQCTVPVDLGPATAIAGGDMHSLALRADGSVRAWGYNYYGQCSVPGDVGTAIAIAGGGGHSAALLSDGSVRAWGFNALGQCNVPSDLGRALAVAAGDLDTVALLADGSVRAWGHSTAAIPGDLGTAVAVASRAYHVVALTCAEPVVDRSSGNLGPIGAGTPRQFTFSELPAAASSATLRVRVRSDLNLASEFLTLRLDGVTTGTLFVSGANDCPATPDEASVVIPLKALSGYLADGALTVRLEASPLVSATQCADGRCEISLVYDAAPVDCNANGIEDTCEVRLAGNDCNANEVPDSCDVAAGTSADVNVNGTPDECEYDCNGNGLPDSYEIAQGLAPDCNANAQVDSCDLAQGLSSDCNEDGVPDGCEIAAGAADVDGNGVPDSCQEDCDRNAVPDTHDRLLDPSKDCDDDLVLDSCEIASDASLDCDGDGILNGCELSGGGSDCNGNGLPDSCDLASGASTDLDGSGVPDECEFVVGGSGYPSIEAAVAAAPSGQTVLVGPGTYPAQGLVVHGKSIVLRSIGGAAATVLDGSACPHPIVQVMGPATNGTIIEGFTFANGGTGPQGPNGGAGMNLQNTGAIVRDCVFVGNVVDFYGGAIFAVGFSGRIDRCRFEDNEAWYGGAVLIDLSEGWEFEDCVFDGNRASDAGGAIRTSASAGTFRDCVFIENSAHSTGGAMVIYSTSGLLTISGCVIDRNVAIYVGGVSMGYPSTNVLIANTRMCANLASNVSGDFTDGGGNRFSGDCNSNGECDADEIAAGTLPDCNANGIPDSCDVAAGTADVDGNGVPDSCQGDCNGNGIPDNYEYLLAPWKDCDGDRILDSCEIAADPALDCTGNGRIDACDVETANGDCNANGVPDSCEIAGGAQDKDMDGALDDCEFAWGDFNLDGEIDSSDLATVLALWGLQNPPIGDLNGDGVVDAIDLATVLSNWGTTPLPPSISSVTPSSGSSAGGTTVTIRGSGFDATTSVTIGGAQAIVIEVLGSTTMKVLTPAGELGERDVVVQSFTGSATAVAGFTYADRAAPPWATMLEPLPSPGVVTSPSLRAAIMATGLPWRVRDNATQIEMVLVPPGSFQMGCSPSMQYGCIWWENPVHTVTLTTAFYMGRHEVTQAQWVARMGSNPSVFQSASADVPPSEIPMRPVENLPGAAINAFLAASGLRLPTEAEWEYACRAGTSTAFHGWPARPAGTDDDSLVGQIAWSGVVETRPVGGKAPNGFGLHDMAGNVAEWVSDSFSEDYYHWSPATDPSGPPWNSATRVLRGGSCWGETILLRSSNRTAAGFVPDATIGFRVARFP